MLFTIYIISEIGELVNDRDEGRKRQTAVFSKDASSAGGAKELCFVCPDKDTAMEPWQNRAAFILRKGIGYALCGAAKRHSHGIANDKLQRRAVTASKQTLSAV